MLRRGSLVALIRVAFAIKPWLGLVFFAVYAVYFWREIRGGHINDQEEELAPLKLQPRAVRPTTTAVLAQTLGALAVIFVSSQMFVHQLDAIGPMLGLSGAVTALLLSPIATELSEIMNAIICSDPLAAGSQPGTEPVGRVCAFHAEHQCQQRPVHSTAAVAGSGMNRDGTCTSAVATKTVD
jgi:hypothetical protein